MTPEQVATYCSVALHTVYNWRSRRSGPRGVRVGKHLRYRRSDVDAWLEAHADPLPA